jgi:hypothetical protein
MFFMIKLIVMFLCFGSFIFTGNPWAAVAVFILGMTLDEVVAPPPTPQQIQLDQERWQRHKVQCRQRLTKLPPSRASSFERRTTMNPPRDTTPFPLTQPRKSLFSF